MQREGNPVRDLLCVNTYKLLNPRKDKEEPAGWPGLGSQSPISAKAHPARPWRGSALFISLSYKL